MIPLCSFKYIYVAVFEDVIGLVVYVTKIHDRGDIWHRPSSHIVKMSYKYWFSLTIYDFEASFDGLELTQTNH